MESVKGQILVGHRWRVHASNAVVRPIDFRIPRLNCGCGNQSFDTHWCVYNLAPVNVVNLKRSFAPEQNSAIPATFDMPLHRGEKRSQLCPRKFKSVIME
jgi:hypothetical protein